MGFFQSHVVTKHFDWVIMLGFRLFEKINKFIFGKHVFINGVESAIQPR